jgi:hypothetical protein
MLATALLGPWVFLVDGGGVGKRRALMLRARFRMPALTLSFLLLVSVSVSLHSVEGAEVPSSALSDAQLIPSSLLDQPTLVFRFPQLATRYESQFFMMSGGGSGSTDLFGGGAIGRHGRCGLFALVQNRDPWTRLGDGYGWSGLGSRMFQGGFGSAWGPFRLGLALRGSMEGGETIGETRLPDSERFEQTYSRYRDDLVEVGTGIGWGVGQTTVDLALEVASLDQAGTEYSLERTEHDPDDYWHLRFKRKKEPVLTTAIRGRIPLGSRAEALLAGYWGEAHTNWTGHARTETDTLLNSRPYLDNWGVDIAVAGPASKVDWLAVSASYRSYRKALLAGRYVDYVSPQTYSTQAYARRSGYAGFSLRKRIIDRLDGYAGVRGVYQLTRTERRVESWIRSSEGSQETNESFASQAAWGLSFSWRSVRLTGRLTTTLELSQPFIKMDASVAL